ncbi:tRNA(Ser) (uridine(44)-2'-O)-methyltransferase [Malassezia brasiliensis]|uniref:tRNA (uracil-O(2)-)-methyltransferase n=1 Tax=Malassezia brasiliensis TaxID=1821822 RepID=A0AAF0DPQ8_9BASI|nr:tRNA(Ser) (uridine(44)-2'-O)-methyltransferase [Malassezia brasiliensis]
MPLASGGASARALFAPQFVGTETPATHEAPLADVQWLRMVQAPAPYARENWLATMHEWIRHPERNSSSIRRCEVWAEEAHEGAEGLQYRCIRRLLPRRTQIDRGMLQECAIYTHATHAVVVYTTLRSSDQASEAADPFFLAKRSSADAPQRPDEVPYYHPAVRGVAFHFLVHPHEVPQVCVDFAPFSLADQHDALTENGRLGRTALSLLRLLHQHSYGHATDYTKRVVHDVLVPRDEYQDLYIALRTQYASALLESWREVTDPKKHVFEDLGIAAYLMLLWRDMFPAPAPSDDARRGRRWGQPPGGFVDVGCGNGLLVHILHLEGYAGYGIDARARKSWDLYAEQGTRLTVSLLDAPAILRGDACLPTGSFLIGNHADELTPWIPVLASTRMPTVPHRTPCDAAQLLSATLWFAQRLTKSPDEHAHSKHLAYYAYISRLHMQAGWCMESEALRIPSTKNWALIGRWRVDATGVPGTVPRARQWTALAAHAASLAGAMIAHTGAHE